eukprot:149951_1
MSHYVHVTLIAMVSISVILAICQIYGIYRFKLIYDLLIVEKRYPKLVITEAFAVVFLCIVTIPFSFNYLLQATQFARFIIGETLISFTSLFIANIESTRLWLISFELHYLHSSKNEKWKSQIDTNFAVKNWYLSNMNKYGNVRYVLSISMAFFLIAALISSFSFIYFGLDRLYFGELIHGTFLSVPVMIILYTYYKSPKHSESEDNFLFHYEFRYSTFIYVTQVGILYPVVQFVDFLGFRFVHIVCMFFSTMIGLILPSLLSTLWITRQISSDDRWNKKLNLMQTNIKSNTNEIDQLKMIFCDEHKFELFVHWMFREFSSETILCVIETIQFKLYLIDIIKNEYKENMECQYKFYKNIPQSSIIYAHTYEKTDADLEKNSVTYQRIASMLYRKYIEEYAEFEINISGELRNKYQILHERNWKVNIKEMVNIFDPIIDELIYLMIGSFVRFKNQN